MRAYPVVLLHGIDDTQAKLERMARHLEQTTGCQTHSFNLIPNHGEAGLDNLAFQVVNYIETNIPKGERIDLVGFSMGGLVARYYVQRLRGIDRVRRLVTISSPHRGTMTGFLRPNIGARQMRPNSGFLRDLNRDLKMLDQCSFTSIWTPLDLMIIPANSSVLPCGRNIPIPVPGHAWMATDARVCAAVAESLR